MDVWNSVEVHSTVEGPAYNRSEKRVLIVGPGSGRELNPQQGRKQAANDPDISKNLVGIMVICGILPVSHASFI